MGKTHAFLGRENLLAEQYFPKTVFFLLFIIVQGCKVFFVEACKEGTENGGQREILKRIIQNLEERPQNADLRRLQEIVIFIRNGGNARIIQCFKKGRRFSVRCTEKNDNIFAGNITESTVIVHYFFMVVEKRTDSPGNQTAFQCGSIDVIGGRFR